MAKTIVLSTKKTEINLEQTVLEVKGKRVLGKNGEVIGKVKDIVITEKIIEGIIVKSNGKKVFIELNYIDQLFNDSIMLKIDPVTRFLGMKVFDAQGKILGKVVDITRSSKLNAIQSIVIKKGMMSKQKTISASHIETAKKNIILKTVENER
ncbi:MAG: PRC-barrel domain-containing protein [bacterium]